MSRQEITYLVRFVSDSSAKHDVFGSSLDDAFFTWNHLAQLDCTFFTFSPWLKWHYSIKWTQVSKVWLYSSSEKKNDIKYIEIFNEQKGTKLCPVVCALSYVPTLCHHVLALDRAWAFCAHHAGHQTIALLHMRSLFLTSYCGTGLGTGNLPTWMHVFPECKITLTFLMGCLEQHHFSAAPHPCAPAFGHIPLWHHTVPSWG